MLKASMFFIVFLGSRTGADRSERCLRQMWGEGRRMSAGYSPMATGARRKPEPTH